MEAFVLRSLNERIGAGSDSASAPGGGLGVTLHAGLRSTYERLGAPVGASLSADVAQVNTTVNNIGVDIGDASASTLGSVYAILGNPAETFLAKLGTTAEAAGETGSVLARLKFLMAATVKGTGTAIGANKSLVDALGHDGIAVANSGLVAHILGNTTGGTLTTLAARIGDNASSRSLHALIGDSATTVHAKLGAAGDASTANTVFGLIGDPGDAAVNPGNEGSLFAHVRGVYNAVSGAPKKNTFSTNIAQLTAAGALTGSPTVGWSTLVTKTDVTTYTDSSIAFDATISAPDAGTKTVDSCDIAVHWRSKRNATATSAESKWAVVAGASATVTGKVDLTDEVTTTLQTNTEYTRSGQVKLSSMATLPFTLMLLTKSTGGAGSAVDSEVASDSYIDVTYSL